MRCRPLNWQPESCAVLSHQGPRAAAVHYAYGLDPAMKVAATARSGTRPVRWADIGTRDRVGRRGVGHMELTDKQRSA